MPLFPAAKVMDMVVGIDIHAMVPGIPIHPYFGVLFLWHTPKFPSSNIFINGMPSCAMGSMGYFVHIPQGIPSPTTIPQCSYWTRAFTNVVKGASLMALTTFANIAIAGIGALLPKPKFAEDFIQEVTGIDTSSTANMWESIKSSFEVFTKWQTWVKLLMPPLPYPGSQGSSAIGSPNSTVNGSGMGFVAPLMATSCSDLPFVPNGMKVGFTNVMVGVSVAAMIKGILVNAASDAIAMGAGSAARKKAG